MDKKNHIEIEDEVTLKQLILKVQEFYHEILSNKITILLFIIPLVFIFGYKSYISKPSYNAELTFMLNTNGGSGVGGLGSLLGQFGLGGKGEASKEKIMSLNKSRFIISNAIFEKVTINDENKLLANHIINHLDSLGKWVSTPPWYKKFLSKPDDLTGFRFSEITLDSLDELSKKALKRLYFIIVGNTKSGSRGMMSNGFDDDSGIMHISATTNDPKLSIAMCNIIYDKLSEFYIEKAIEKQKVTYDVLREKNDSILNLLVKRETELAYIEDRQHGIWRNKDNLKKKLIGNDVRKLSIMYGEITKNLEIADFSLRNKTPFVQPIDRPILPISGQKSGLIKSLIMGGILGFILGAFFVMIRKIFRDTMSEEY